MAEVPVGGSRYPTLGLTGAHHHGRSALVRTSGPTRNDVQIARGRNGHAPKLSSPGLVVSIRRITRPPLRSRSESRLTRGAGEPGGTWRPACRLSGPAGQVPVGDVAAARRSDAPPGPASWTGTVGVGWNDPPGQLSLPHHPWNMPPRTHGYSNERAKGAPTTQRANTSQRLEGNSFLPTTVSSTTSPNSNSGRRGIVVI
jgi:hypothetical protein